MTVHYNLDVCQDCLCFIANGDLPNDDENWRMLPEWDGYTITTGKAREQLDPENFDAIEDAAREVGINPWQVDWECGPEVQALIEKIEQAWQDSESEGVFSWSRCDGCGGLAGTRYPVTARKNN